jgi:hypothetical protein
MWAAGQGHGDVVDRLIAYKADVNAKDNVCQYVRTSQNGNKMNSLIPL